MVDRTTKSWVLALTALASFMVALDALVVTTALDTIRRDVSASIEALQWIVNAYNLSFAVLLLAGAALGDRFGRRRMFAAGIALFVAASAACALANDANQLIAARALQGVGAALVMPLAMALLSAVFPPEERGKALGIFGGVTGLALIAGPVIGGAVVEGLAWPWIFWVNVPLGLIMIPLVLRHVPESRGPATALDFGGIALATLAALALVSSLMRGNHAGWTSPGVLAGLIAGLVLAAAFVLWQVRARTPMVPLRFFRSAAFSAGMASSFFFYAALYGVVFLLPQFFQAGQGRGPLSAGLCLLAWTATLFVTAPIAGRMINRFGERALVVVGLLMQAAGMLWLALIVSPAAGYSGMVAPLILAGIGISAAMPAAQTAVLNAVAPPDIGNASGVFNMARFLGGVFGIALLGAVFSATGSVATAATFSRGFAAAMVAAALLSLLAAGAGARLPMRRGLAVPGVKSEAAA